MFKPGENSSHCEAPEGLLITGGTSGTGKIIWDTGNNRLDLGSNPVKITGIIYADGGIQRSSAAVLNIGGGLTTGVTVIPLTTFNSGAAFASGGGAPAARTITAPSASAMLFNATAYLDTNGLSLDYATNATATTYLNFVGYQAGVTQFRNTVIGDGKAGAVATFSGSAGTTTLHKPVTFSGGFASQTISGAVTWSGAHKFDPDIDANGSYTFGNEAVLVEQGVSGGGAALRVFTDGTNNRIVLRASDVSGTAKSLWINGTSADNYAKFDPTLITLSNPVTANGRITVNAANYPMVLNSTSGTNKIAIQNAAAGTVYWEGTSTNPFSVLNNSLETVLNVSSAGALTAGVVVALNSTNASTAVIEMNTSSDTYSSHIKVGRSTTEDAEIGVGASGDLMIAGSGGGDLNVLVNGSSRGINFSVDSGTTIAARINADTSVTFNGRIAAAAGQITFPATPNPSADANTLDEYEEGSFTPTGNGVTFTSATGRYVKIGKMVYASVDCTWPTTSDTGVARIESLPFTVSSSSPGGVAISYSNYGTPHTAEAVQGTTYVHFTTWAGVQMQNVAYSAKRIKATLVYQAAQ